MYHTLLRSSVRNSIALWTAVFAIPALNTQLTYDSMSRDETFWQHIVKQTKRSCQDLVPLLQNIVNKEEQYLQLIRLLIHDGPCAPGFLGFDILQDPGDDDASESECVLVATTAHNSGRHSLMVVQRQNTAHKSTHQHEDYVISGQYLAPAHVHRVFRSSSHTSFCNVRDFLEAPASASSSLTRVRLWTTPVKSSEIISHDPTPQIVSSRSCF